MILTVLYTFATDLGKNSVFSTKEGAGSEPMHSFFGIYMTVITMEKESVKHVSIVS